MGEQPFFEAAQKYQRELQPLGGVKRHQRNLRPFVVGVGVAYQRGVIQKLVERFAAVFGVHSGIHQLAQVFNSRVGLRRVFDFEKFYVSGAVDQKF